MFKLKFVALAIILFSFVLPNNQLLAQVKTEEKNTNSERPKKNTKTLYGQASYYSQKFEGRRTASGQTFSHKKYTAACNMLPLGTFIKVTNLKNGKTLTIRGIKSLQVEDKNPVFTTDNEVFIPPNFERISIAYFAQQVFTNRLKIFKRIKRCPII